MCCNFPIYHYLYLPAHSCNRVQYLIQTYPVFLFEKHFEDFFHEEEEVKSSEHHCRLGHVEVNHRVKAKGLPPKERGDVT